MFRKAVPVFDEPDTNNVHMFKMKMETSEAVAIHMPESSFKDLTRLLESRGYHEIDVRKKYPALQKAWDQYEMILNLCKGDE